MADSYGVFKTSDLDDLCRALGDCMTGSQMTTYFSQIHIEEQGLGPGNTKRLRLFDTFSWYQQKYGTCKHLLVFIENSLSAMRLQSPEYQDQLDKINRVLITKGFELLKTGKIIKDKPIPSTNEEIDFRFNSLLVELKRRHVSEEIIEKYCKKELMGQDGFHSLHEAAKGLLEKIRNKTNRTEDGQALIDVVFSVKKPLLVWNSLQTTSDISSHKGIIHLLSGVVALIRNSTAHEVACNWQNPTDLADYFSLMSMLYRKVDVAIPVTYQ